MNDSIVTMANYGSTQTYKVPLKFCRDSVIDHDLVAIRLNVEWAEKGGDEPCLIIHITKNQPPNSYFQISQPSVLVDPIHHHQQQHHQESYVPIHQQQCYHPPTMDNCDSSNLTATNPMTDHNDISSMTTTTTVVYNSPQPQYPPSASSLAIQKIKSHLKSQLPSFSCQSSTNSPYLSPQHVIQAPPNNLNDSRLDMNLSAINPTSFMTHMSSVIAPYSDFQQPPTMPCSSSASNNYQRRSLICLCPNPPNDHAPNCAMSSMNSEESNMNFFPESAHQPPMTQTNFQCSASVPQGHSHGCMSWPSMNEPMNSTTLLPFSNPNLMRAIDSTSGVTTIISQPPPLLNNISVDQMFKLGPMSSINSFQRQPINASQVVINNQFNNPTNLSMTMPIGRPKKATVKPPRSRKKSTKQNSLANQDQTLSQSTVEQIQSINNQNSPIKPQIINPPSLFSSQVPTPKEEFTLQDDGQLMDHTSSDSTNDLQTTIVQPSSPQTKPNVRSPVNLAFLPSHNSNQATISSEDLDQTISEVLQGRGTISTHNSPIPFTTTQQQSKQPFVSQLVWESDEPISTTTRTFVSPLNQQQESSTEDSTITTLTHRNAIHITQPNSHSNSIEQSPPNTVSPTNDSKKRTLPNSATSPKAKRVPKSKINIQPETSTSTPDRDRSETRTSPTMSTFNGNAKSIPWADTPISSSCSGSASIASVEPTNQHFMTDSLEINLSDIDRHDNMFNYLTSNTEEPRTIYPNDQSHGIELEELLSMRINRPFNSSTPSLSSSMTTNQLLHSVSVENPSNTPKASTTNTADIYDYFVSNLSSSSSTLERHPTNSTVITSSDPQDSSLFEQQQQQQHYSEIDNYFDANSQSQTHLSSFPEIISNHLNSMNLNNDVQTSEKQQTKISSKKNQSLKHRSKQRNPPKPIRKQSLSKPKCTRCGSIQLIDITRHEFPKQRGLVFECSSCGNNSIRSNVSPDERKRRLDKVAADHLHKVECQFCRTMFYSHNEYITHLRDDHKSDKPM